MHETVLPLPRRSQKHNPQAVPATRKAFFSRPEPLEARIAPAFVHPFDPASLNGVNGFAINGVAANDFVGTIAEAGDVNGDGFGDLIIAASGVSGGSNNPGAAYVVFGKATGFDPALELSALNGMDGFKLAAADPATDRFLNASGAGDVNGDGFADVVVGTSSANGLPTGPGGPLAASAGAAWVVFGKAGPFDPSVSLATLDGTNGFKFTGNKPGDFIGISVDAAGDVNNDGFADVIIGSSLADRTATITNSGAAYVIFGQAQPFPAVLQSDGLSNRGFRIFGGAKNDALGESVSGAGDVNGDGFDDLIVGSRVAGGAGAAYVIYGSQFRFLDVVVSTLNGAEGFKLRGGVANDQFGFRVDAGGDINGDGLADLLVGAPGGAVAKSYVLFGRATAFPADVNLATLNGTTGFRILSETNGDGAYEIGAAGDVNADGFDDILVGAQLADGAVVDSGAAYLIFGQAGGFGPTFALASLNGTNGVKYPGLAFQDFVGATAGKAGDVNGDGFDDLVFGARGADPGGRAQAGQAYVIFGSDTGAVTHPGNTNANTLTGTGSGDILVAGGANDTLIGAGGADLLRGGEGEDILAISDLTFRRAHGGLGSDTLRLDGAGLALNLATLNDFQLRGIEAIDLTGAGANSLTLTRLDLLRLSGESNTLTVFGNAGDSVDFGTGWLRADSELVGVVPFAVFFNGEAKLRIAPGVTTSATNGFVLGQSGDFKMIGPSVQDRAGQSIANAGDVNGDGFDDVIIGAGSANGSQNYSGAAYVVFGKADGFAGGFDLGALNGTDGFRIIGTAQSFGVGRSVGAAGDFNGDGFADVIVGAPSSFDGGSYAGAAYVIFGKASGFTATVDAATLTVTDGFRFTGEAVNQILGDQVGLAGDLNGDGLDDLFVGASGADQPTGGAATIADTGAVHVILGTREKVDHFGPSSLFFRGFSIFGAAKSDRLSAGGAAGDINGDGFDDLIVGAKYADANGFDSGAAYVIYGKGARIGFPFNVADLDGTNGFRLRGENSSDRLGTSVSGAGDVNGDGFADLLVGTGTFNNIYGASYVVFGKSGSFGATFNLATLNGANGFEMNGGVNQFGAGRAVAGAGDVNGDGFDDILLGADGAGLRARYSGGAVVVFGKAGGFTPSFSLGSLDGQNGFVLSGEAALNSAGAAVGGGGDFNGDGFDDVLIGALNHASSNGAYSGAAYVYFGADLGAVTHPGNANANTLTGDAGANVLVAGDGNDLVLGNGGADASRGAKGDDVFGLSALDFRRIHGGTGIDTLRFDGAGLALNLTTLADSRLQGIERIDLAGTGANSITLSPLEVLNLSPTSNMLTIVGGADDFVNLGPNWFRGVPENIGGTDFTVLHNGEATLKVAAGVGTSPIAGWSLARQNGERAFTIKGMSANAFGNFGQYAASAGDVNGDGFEDVIIGDYAASVGGVIRGAAYVVFGQAGGFAPTLEASALVGTNGFRITDTSAAFNDNFAQRVSGAGDVNGDGFADVIVSDASDDVAGANTGAAWVIFGGSGPFTADLDVSTINGANGFKLTGEAVDDRLGNGVSGAGDVNGDGFADVMVSALGADPNGSYSGAVYVVFGKAGGFTATMPLTSLNGANGFRLDGEATRNFTGISLAAAGDANGDGFGDILIGARADPHGVDSGSAYLVFGKADGFAAKIKLSSLNGTSGARFDGAKAKDYAEHVGGAGDINGDGLADIVIGAVGVDRAGSTYDGAAYIVFGKRSAFAAKVPLSGLTAADGFRVIGEGGNAFVGVSVTTAGDVNGDGFDDALIVSTNVNFDGRYSGGAYVLLGKAGGFGSSVSVAQIDGENLGFRLSGAQSIGEIVAAGDVNGDGFDDVILGERGGSASGVGFGPGVVRVFLGLDTGAVTDAGDGNVNTLTGDANANVIVAGQSGDTLLGNGGADAARGGQGDDLFAVSDVNFRRLHGGTGLDTLRLDGAGLALNLTTLADPKLTGFEHIDITGSGANTLTLSVREVMNLSPTSNTLTVIGDVGDRVNFGAGWIREPDATIGGAPFQVFTSGAATLRISAAVAHSLPSGYALPFFNDGQVGFVIDGEAANDSARNVSAAGDVNGDGFDDFLIGAAQADPNGNSSGAAYVVFGQIGGFTSVIELTALDGTNGFAIHGEAASNAVGYNQSAAGDFNGDGFGDIILGSNKTTGASQSGTAYLIYGKAAGFDPALELSSLNGTNGFQMRATAFSVLTSVTVSSAGDVDGDGFSDVVIGTPNFTTGALTQKGAAYVVFGRATSPALSLDLATLNGTNGFAMIGTAKFDLSGRAVGGGDVNGDGFSDVIVGGNGRAHVVFGKATPFAASLGLASLNGTNGFELEATLNSRGGESVSRAGDVNGDGLGDLIVGAPFASGPGGLTGEAYVVFGKPGNTFGAKVKLSALNGATGFRIAGIDAGDKGEYLGQAVSAAGDVNGDGFDDVLVGAAFTDTRGFQTGEAYVIYGKVSFAPTVSPGALDGINGFALIGTEVGARAANSVAGVGDVNGDGFDDVLVGTLGPLSGPLAAQGRSFFVFGFDNGAVTHRGDAGANTLTGDAGANVFVAGQDDDSLLGNGGADAMRGAEGDDVFGITDPFFRRITGGHGTDTLRLEASGVGLNLLTLGYEKLSGIERIDIKGTGVNSLVLDLRHVLNLSPTSNTLIVARDADDPVLIGAGWISQGNEIIGVDSFLVFKQGAATLKVQEGSLAVTPVNATTATFTDVDGDLVTVKVSKGLLSFADLKLAPAGNVGGFQLQAVNFSDDGIEFQGANLTITAARTALGGDGRVNVGRVEATGIDLGNVSIDGDLRSIAAGDPNFATTGLAALKIGSMGLFGLSTLGPAPTGFSIVNGTLGTLDIDSDLVDSPISAFGPVGGMSFGKVTIGGSIVGGTAGFTGLFADRSTGAIMIGQDLRAGTAIGAGVIQVGGNVASLTIGGSVIGQNSAFDSVKVTGTLGATKIGGDLESARITARGGIASLAVTGSVLSARVLAGYDGGAGFNGDATIGAVTVGGDWVASDLVAGVGSTDGFFGNGGENVITGENPAKIAKITSIAIKGQAIGTPGGTDHFGFVAEEIGSFTVGGTKFPLTSGKSNDLAGLDVGATIDVKVREVNATASPVEPPFIGAGGSGSAFPLTALDGSNGFRFDGEGAGATAGRSVAGAGDVNGDGFNDVIIGANGAGTGFAGEAYVIFGRMNGFDPTLDPADLDGTNGFRLFRGIAAAQFGLAVGAAGDVNNDGYADVIVGQIEGLGLGGSQTSAFVVFGKPTPFATALDVSTLDGTNGFEVRAPVNTRNGVQFRMGVSSAGDLNGDGRDDVIMGVTNSDFNGLNSGSDYVFFSPASGSPATFDGGALNGSNGFRFDATSAGQAVGYSVSEAGDINGDGLDDIVLGIPNETASTNRQGAAYVIFGKTTAYPSVLNPAAVMAGSGVLGFRILGAGELSVAGASVDSAGDVNGDGFDDLIVGAPYADVNGNYSGASYVIYGKTAPFGSELALASLNGSNGFRISGESQYDYAGRVAGVRDVNGDGFDDLLIGAIGLDADFEFKGGAYLVFGRAAAPAEIQVSTALKLSGTGAADETGGSVAGAGDVNGDGQADLIIGADRADNTGNFSGSAYVVLQVSGTTGVAAEVTFSNGQTTATFNDVDGDLVTIKTTAGQFQQSDFTLAQAGRVGGAQLQKIDLSGATHAAFAGANITITAGRGPLGGDGFVNVGALLATDNDLGKVSIDGDLGQLDTGNGDPLKPAVAALTVQSLGRLGLSTQAPAGASLESNIKGKLGAFTVKSDLVGAFVNINGSAIDGDDDSGAITIGGALRGGALAGSGSIFSAGDLGAVKIGGSILGGAGAHSGSVEAGGKIASITLGGSLRGGAGPISGSLIAGTTMGAVKIDGDASASRILARGNNLPTSDAFALALKSITIGGSVLSTKILAGFDREAQPANADAQIGDVTVNNDWITSDLVAGVQTGGDGFFGNSDERIAGGGPIIARIADILIKGQAFGTPAAGDHFGFVAEQIGSLRTGNTSVPLKVGASNDLAGLPVGATLDLRVSEV